MALIFYVDNVGGGSGYSGSSSGSPKASGTMAVTTTSSATVSLSGDTPNLSTAVIGDTIRLDTRTDGIRSTDIFEITAVDDTLDTVNVTPTPTGPTTTGVWVIGGAFNNIGRPADLSSPGDKTWIKNSDTYKESVNLTRAGSNVGSIIYEGYTAITGDKGIAVIDGENTRSSGIYDNTASNDIYHVFKNIEVINHTGNGADISSSFITWKNCKFNNNDGNGFRLITRGLNFFEACEFNDNGGCGFSGAVLSTFNQLAFIGCDFMRNVFNGACSDASIYSYCTLFDNSIAQIKAIDDKILFINNCTIDGQDKDNIGVDAGSIVVENVFLINTIIVGCASGFIASSGMTERLTSRSNCFYDNIINYVSGALTNENEILDDPKFFGRAAQDYRLTSSSPCIGQGYDGASLSGYTFGCDIGAYQSI